MKKCRRGQAWAYYQRRSMQRLHYTWTLNRPSPYPNNNPSFLDHTPLLAIFIFPEQHLCDLSSALSQYLTPPKRTTLFITKWLWQQWRQWLVVTQHSTFSDCDVFFVLPETWTWTNAIRHCTFRQNYRRNGSAEIPGDWDTGDGVWWEWVRNSLLLVPRPHDLRYRQLKLLVKTFKLSRPRFYVTFLLLCNWNYCC